MILRLFFFFTAILLMAESVSAQLMVQAKPNRELYLKGEPVMMIVAVRNMTGREITLDGRANSSENWLGFEVKTRDGGQVSTFQKEIEMEPVTLAPGEILRRKINLSRLYVLDGVGDFRVKAHVFFEPIDKYFYTSASFFTLTPGKVIWKRTVGAPDGTGNSEYRTYELATLTDLETTRLYVRVLNATHGGVQQCMMLDKLVQTANPQATIDGRNQLHLLFMSRPQMMTYLHLGFNGELLRQERFRTNSTYPRMLQMADGSIRISGGSLLPSQESLEALREAAGPPPRVSDRPGS